MKTAKYVEKFRLDDSRFANHFDTDLFIQDFTQEFQERIDHTIFSRKKSSLVFEFRIFQNIVREMQQKFCAISNKKANGPLRTELWNAFYAKAVIPARIKYFPAEHAEIELKRKKAAEKAEREKILSRIISSMGDEFFIAKSIGGQVYKNLLARINAQVDKEMVLDTQN